jgi:FlaA1/EpsC-like NDP-sugar epimerase
MFRNWYMILADMLLTVLAIIFGLMLRLRFFISGSIIWLFFKIIWPYILLTAIVHPLVFYFTGIYSLIWRYATTNDFFRLTFSVLLVR